MNSKEKIKTFHERKKHHLAMGGAQKLEARKAEGKLNARERLEYFFDQGTLLELGLLAHSALPGMEESRRQTARSSVAARSKEDRSARLRMT